MSSRALTFLVPIPNYQNEILDLYDNTEHEGEEERGRRFIRWRFIRGLERDLTSNFMAKIREKVHTSFYVRHIFSYQLHNIEDGSLMVMYTNIGSPWFESFSDAEKWLSEREKVRLDPDNINRPDTKWVFENQFNVDVKVVLDRQPLVRYRFHYQIGCVIVRVGVRVQWLLLILTKTIYVFGAVLRYTEVQDQIKVQRQHGNLLRVSFNLIAISTRLPKNIFR